MMMLRVLVSSRIGSPPCLMALTSRLEMMRSNRRTSVTSVEFSAASCVSIVCPARAPEASMVPRSERTAWSTSTRENSGFARPASRRETSRRSSTRICMRCTRSLTSSAGRESSSSRFAALTSPVSGVRISWARSAVKRCSESMRSVSRATAVSTAVAKAHTSWSDSSMTSAMRVEVSPPAIFRAACAPRVSRREMRPATIEPTPPTTRAEPIMPTSSAWSMRPMSS